MNREILTRAEEAESILTSELFLSVFASLDAELIAGWRSEQDAAKREQYYHRQAALEWVRASLVEFINAAAEAEFRDEGNPGYWRRLWDRLRSKR
jgi:hypothetical protein